MESVVKSIVDTLQGHGISPQVITFIISMIPVLELRGSIIVAGGLMNLPIKQTF